MTFDCQLVSFVTARFFPFHSQSSLRWSVLLHWPYIGALLLPRSEKPKHWLRLKVIWWQFVWPSSRTLRKKLRSFLTKACKTDIGTMVELSSWSSYLYSTMFLNNFCSSGRFWSFLIHCGVFVETTVYPSFPVREYQINKIEDTESDGS